MMDGTPGWDGGAPQPLTGEEVLFLHYRLIERMGGRHGVKDVGLLREALARPARTLQGRPVFATPFERAAVLMHALATGEPFEDGNLETALAAGVLALAREGLELRAGPADLAGALRRVAAGSMTFRDLAGWLEDWSRPAREARSAGRPTGPAGRGEGGVQARGGGAGRGGRAWRPTTGSGRRSGRGRS
ncbi:MAG: Fic family protein [Acetobacteraceae bacterium]|nr:Fic family protein [Acetobacteraceae bacterium]